MTDTDVLAAEAAFFAALCAADGDALAAVLTDDFLLVDVMAGQVIPREALVAAVASRQLEFVDIVRDTADVSIRRRAGLAVVVGRTRLVGRFAGSPFTAHSRYTHVYVDDGGWRLLAAQGTRESEPPPVPA